MKYQNKENLAGIVRVKITFVIQILPLFSIKLINQVTLDPVTVL